MKAAKLLDKSIRSLKKQSPTILTCIGAVGVVTTAVLAVRATPKALELANEEIRKQNRALLDEATKNGYDVCNQIDKLKPIEMVKVAWKPYIPAVAVGMATIACVFSANVLNRRQQAALTSAYMLLDQTYKEYRSKAIELFGKDMDDQIQSSIAKDKYEGAEKEPGNGKLLFYEAHYGKFFERTMLEVRDAEYQLNRKLKKWGAVSLNDFFEFLDLPKIDAGDTIGWAEELVCDYYNPAWVDFEHELVVMDDGMECYIINMSVTPALDFDLPF